MSRERRVLFIVPSAYPVGGLATWLDRLLPDLEALGWESWLGLPDGRWSNADDYLEMHPFSRVVRLSNPTATRLGRVRAVDRALDRVRPDVVVVANLVDLFRAVARRRSSGLPTPRVVSTIHSLIPGLFADLDRAELAIDLLVAPNRLVEVAATALTAFDPQRICYASYGVELLEADEISRAPASENLELVYPGRFNAGQKAILDLPRILASLEARAVRWTLDLAGAGPLEAELLRQLERFGSRVRWHGALPPARAREELLQPGRVLILTSRWELGPVVAWEAMARGVVVASTRFVGAGLEDSLRDRETALLWGIGKIEAAADQISLLVDPDYRSTLAAAAWQLARERYARPVAAQAWHAALERALDLPERPNVGAAPPPKPGRLERLVGEAGAEWLRKLSGRAVYTSGPGDEWPSSGSSDSSYAEFFDLLASMDSRGGEVAAAPGGVT